MKKIVITTDQLSKCTALAEILETVFPECEIRIIVGEGLKTGHEKTPRMSTSPIHWH